MERPVGLTVAASCIGEGNRRSEGGGPSGQGPTQVRDAARQVRVGHDELRRVVDDRADRTESGLAGQPFCVAFLDDDDGDAFWQRPECLVGGHSQGDLTGRFGPQEHRDEAALGHGPVEAVLRLLLCVPLGGCGGQAIGEGEEQP